MPTPIRENRAKRMLKASELVLVMGVNQLRTPNIAMISAACGFDAVYIDLEHNPTSLETVAGAPARRWASAACARISNSKGNRPRTDALSRGGGAPPLGAPAAAKRAREPQAVKDWRGRVQTKAGQVIFARHKRIERIHAHCKQRSLGRLNKG